ncbi:hypothetical protein GSI_11269 [Ganoderma sinense ZZ0214-1]|uniref:BTB domain-containing protein n=1 Tax=Ganoderma sinense ZZ0214-1 TaxID=1077348 RepID=A0A2G8RYT3_9APHY|nr:hypothetical protein GSI_11269 [Ganoderma sinense ZZ0214-1]
MGDSTSDNSIKRDSEIWFEDGNIVVVAQNTAFRFHKSVVSLHSSVFRDLFSIPQPSSVPGEDLGVDETFDCCPVVHVSDTSYDFRELLRAIYSGVRLKRHFTTRLSAWDARGGTDGKSLLRLSAPDVIEALNLFRLIDRPDMVPIALYECAWQLGPAFLLHGARRSGDGATLERLSPADTELCMEVKEELLQATACLLTRLCEACDGRIDEISPRIDPGSGCAAPAHCVEGLKTVMRRARRDVSECLSADPLDMYYMSAAVSFPVTGEICRACGIVVKAAYTQERRRIWEGFPKLMRVEVAGWDSG